MCQWSLVHCRMFVAKPQTASTLNYFPFSTTIFSRPDRRQSLWERSRNTLFGLPRIPSAPKATHNKLGTWEENGLKERSWLLWHAHCFHCWPCYLSPLWPVSGLRSGEEAWPGGVRTVAEATPTFGGALTRWRVDFAFLGLVLDTKHLTDSFLHEASFACFLGKWPWVSGVTWQKSR